MEPAVVVVRYRLTTVRITLGIQMARGHIVLHLQPRQKKGIHTYIKKPIYNLTATLAIDGSSDGDGKTHHHM